MSIKKTATSSRKSNTKHAKRRRATAAERKAFSKMFAEVEPQAVHSTAPANETAPAPVSMADCATNSSAPRAYDEAPAAGPSWCPSWGISGSSTIPVVNQAERELLTLIEYAAPRESWDRLSTLVSALVTMSNGNAAHAQATRPVR